MNVTIGVIASDDVTEYSQFKKVWVDNIRSTNASVMRHVSVVFIYGIHKNPECRTITETRETHIDMYTPYLDTFDNIIRKTIYFLKHTKTHFIVRTNLSTLLNIALLYNTLLSYSNTHFFGGPIIDAYNGFNTWFSGTCMVMTLDIAKHIVRNQLKISYSLHEDVELSLFVMKTYPYKMTHICIPRLDFIHRHNVLAHKCDISDTIFCFRFKTDNRQNDVIRMRFVYNSIINNQANISDLLTETGLISVVEERYSILCNSLWSINPDTEILSLTRLRRDQQ